MTKKSTNKTQNLNRSKEILEGDSVKPAWSTNENISFPEHFMSGSSHTN